MVLICEDHNENARFTRGTRSWIYFPGSSNNSLWACLCSDFNLRALRSCWRTLMFCLNELTVLLDTALQSTGSPPTDSVTCDKHHVRSLAGTKILDHMLRKATFFSRLPFNFINDWKKYGCCFPQCPIWAGSPLMCEAACEQATLRLLFVTLQTRYIQ